MPVSFSSPPRNLFLLGSSGADVVTNFFKSIDLSSSTDSVFMPDEIRSMGESNYINAGTAQDSNSKEFGWVRNESYDAETDTLSNVFDVRFEAIASGVDTTIRALEVDTDGLVIVGKTGNTPWIGKFSNADGTSSAVQWQATTNTAGVEYTGITVSGGNYYACGSTPTNLNTAEAFVEKYSNLGVPQWGKGAYNLGRDVTLRKIAAQPNGNVIAVGQIEDEESFKGYIVKLDTNTGDVLWDRTIQSFEDSSITKYEVVYPEAVNIDGNGNTYVVGRLIRSLSITRGFIIKYSPEGNILWQKETPLDEYFEFIDVKSDTETQQSIVFGRYYDAFANDWSGVLSKYSGDGTLIWRRILTSSANSSNSFGNQFKVNLDADPAFYYLLFIDQDRNTLNGTPDAFTFGKVSSSGNGLGYFEYEDGSGETLDYEILNVSDREGRLQDGSVSLELSSLISSPFNANKLLFDDYATNISNKKRQMEVADNFQYSGSPAVRPVDYPQIDIATSGTTERANEALYTSAGTYFFTIPDGITEISAVVVGGGGGAAACPGTPPSGASAAGGGGGGGLAYGTMTVTPGEQLIISVGNGGPGGATGSDSGSAGGDSSIRRGSTVLLFGGGGAGGAADAPLPAYSLGSQAAGGTSSGTERDGGGNGGLGGYAIHRAAGGGGGGAAGYLGDGGTGGTGTAEFNVVVNGTDGAGGGGGGGNGKTGSGTPDNGGGGVGLFGAPFEDGAGGTGQGPTTVRGLGGSGGENGGTSGGNFGGGGGGAEDDSEEPGGSGGSGGVRIVWGEGRNFSGNSLDDISSIQLKVNNEGTGITGVSNGATLNADGYWEFDGTPGIGAGDTITFGDTSTFNWIHDRSESHWAIEGWYWNNIDEEYGAMISNNSGTSSVGFYMGQRNDELFECVINKGTVGTPACKVLSTDILDQNRWYHIAFVNENYTVKLYIDGVLQSNAGDQNSFSAGSTADAQTDLRIGKLATSSQWNLNGRIGGLRIYKRPFTEAQAYQNYNSTKEQYTGERPITTPRISDGVIYETSPILYYDFRNRFCYDVSLQNYIGSSDFDGSTLTSADGSYTEGWTTTNAIKTQVDDGPYDDKVSWELETNSYFTAKTRSYTTLIQPSVKQKYCFSVYVKQGTGEHADRIFFQMRRKGFTADTSVDNDKIIQADWYWDSKTFVGTGNDPAEPILYSEEIGNGWWRLAITTDYDRAYFNAGSSPVYARNYLLEVDIHPASKDYNDEPVGMSAIGKTIYYGPQIELSQNAQGIPSPYVKRDNQNPIKQPLTINNIMGTSYSATCPTGYRNGVTNDPGSYGRYGAAYIPEDGSFSFYNHDEEFFSDRIEVGTQFIQGNNPWSISMWVKTEPHKDGINASVERMHVLMAGTEHNGSGLVLVIDKQKATVPFGEPDYIECSISLGVGNSQIFPHDLGSNLTASTTFADETWTLTTWTWDGTTLKAYTNGSADGSTTSISFNITGSTFLIGAGERGTASAYEFANNPPYIYDSMHGWIADVLVYDRAITSAEVSSIYNATRGKYGV